MLKTVEDPGSVIEKLDGVKAPDSGQPAEELKQVEKPLPLREDNLKTAEEQIIRRVHFAKSDEEIHSVDYSAITVSTRNGIGRTDTPTLSSILKSPRLYPLENGTESIDLQHNPIPFNDDPNPERKIVRARRRASIADSNRGDFVFDPQNSLPLEDKRPEASVDQRTVSLPQHLHNTRRSSRRSSDESVDPVAGIEPPDFSNHNENLEADSPLSNGTVERTGRGRGGARGRGRGRGKGRPRGQGGRSSGDVTGEDGGDNFNAVEGGKDVDIPKSKVNLVKCARCGLELSKGKWPGHNLTHHNNMGWLESDPALDLENDQKLLNRILINAHKKKRGLLTCEKCGSVKRSVVGFISHMQFCGKTVEEKSALLMTCPICQRTMMPSSMEVHHRVHREPEPGSAPLPANAFNSGAVTPGSKRKAAERAITRISEFTALVKEDDGPSAKKPRASSPTIKRMIQRPQLRKTIPGFLRSLWKKEITKKGVAACRQTGCDEQFTNIDQLYDHYSKCNFTPRRNFTCRVCKFASENEAEVIRHVTERHTADSVLSEDSESDEYSDEGSDKEEAKKRPQQQSSGRLSQHWRGRPKSWHRIEFLSQEDTPNVNKPYVPAVKWTLEFELENYQLDLFYNLLPNTFELLDDKEADDYWPELRVSMATQKVNIRKYTDKVQTSNVEWRRWNRFESDVEYGMPTFFVGGPVWAMAWLPIPTPLFSHEVDQYLAISTHRTMESEYSLGRSYVGKNVIQVWNVGKLNNKGGTVAGVPSLSYAIAHAGGTIWAMEWCPSGCYQDRDLDNCNKNGQQCRTRRMGLLAAAFSDGCVRIYSMPFPEGLEFSQPNDPSRRIFKTDPVVTLVVNTIMYDDGKQNWQCTKLNWTKERGHDTIVAGFSNGYVALWNITSKSSLLLKNRGNTTFLNASQHFYAHGHAVTAVSLVPYGNKRFLATAGMDRCYKFWNLDSTNGPQSVLKRGVAVDGTWWTHWPAAVNAFDDVLGLNHTCTTLFSLREYGYKLCLALATNSPVYGVSISDYGNAIAHGSLAGEVQMAFPHQLLIGIDVDRTVSRKRRLTSVVKIVDLIEGEKVEEKTSNNRGKKSQKHSEEYKYMPDTYEGCKDRFGIIFCDVPSEHNEPIHTESTRKTLQNEELPMVPLECYPFTSVNKVSWNPNAWSYLWLATGYQCGLIRISCFKPMYIPSTTKDLLPKFAARMLERENQRSS